MVQMWLGFGAGRHQALLQARMRGTSHQGRIVFLGSHEWRAPKVRFRQESSHGVNGCGIELPHFVVCLFFFRTLGFVVSCSKGHPPKKENGNPPPPPPHTKKGPKKRAPPQKKNGTPKFPLWGPKPFPSTSPPFFFLRVESAESSRVGAPSQSQDAMWSSWSSSGSPGGSKWTLFFVFCSRICFFFWRICVFFGLRMDLYICLRICFLIFQNLLVLKGICDYWTYVVDFSLLVFKGICDYWKFFFFSQGS